MPIEQRLEIYIPEGHNKNVDQENVPQLKGTTDLGNEMLLDGIFYPCVHCTVPPIDPTLVTLGNARKNAIRRLPQHHTVVRNNRTTYRRTRQSNIPHPCLANNGGMACIE